MTVQEIEAACIAGKRLDFSRHTLEAASPTGRRMVFPYGIPVEVRCDTPEVLERMAAMWKQPSSGMQPVAVHCKVFVQASGNVQCPPPPAYAMQQPYFMTVADRDNFSLVNLSTSSVFITMQEGVLKHSLYADYFLLSAPLAAITASHATPFHAACVSWNGHGVLLCGDSGAGKSTLAYACAKAGWTYTSDDACYVLHKGTDDRVVIGDENKIRFRPETAQLFPELNKLRMTPRAAGKPSAELILDDNSGIQAKGSARIDMIVFLQRDENARPEISTYRTDVARASMRQTVFGTPAALKKHYRAIDRILQAPVMRLRYSKLDDAVQLLRTAVDRIERGSGLVAAD